MSDVLKIGTRKQGNEYSGVLRRGRTRLFECGHLHTNRDTSTRMNGISAYGCIEARVRAARLPEEADILRAGIRQNAAWLAQERIRVDVDDQLRQLDAALECIRGLIGEQEPVFGMMDAVVLMPPAPRRPCRHCGIELRPTKWLGENPPEAWREFRGPDAVWQPWRDWFPTEFEKWTQRYPRCGDKTSYDHEPAEDD